VLWVPADVGAGEGDVALFFFVEGSNHAAVHDEERTKYVVATAKSALSHQIKKRYRSPKGTRTTVRMVEGLELDRGLVLVWF